MMRLAIVPLGAALVLAAGHARPSDGCRAALASVERRWGGTGEWRRLAPYPVAREASPTDSVGVWLERWTLDDGRVELRRVSARETRVADVTGEGCVMRTTAHARTYDAAAMAGAFTDDSLRATMRVHRRGMVYVWSPGMPLSVRGLAEARAAASALGVGFTAVVADARPGELEIVRHDPVDARTMDALELVYRDATIHYPTALLYADGKPLGTAIPGYKSRDTYEALARGRFAGVAHAPPPPGPTPALWLDRKAQVTTLATVPTVRHVGFFFKPVPGTDLISYTAPLPGAMGGGGESYIFDLKTREERRIPGNVDPVPTPDGRFITRPGLVFHPVPALAAGDETPLFVDPELPDEYQSISILAQSKRALRYRVVTGWRVGLRLRDYDVSLGRTGAPEAVRPASPATVPCPERQFTLPISARGSREVGVYDLHAGTNRIVVVSDDGRCTDVLDLGFASGKLAFSHDGGTIAFATSRVDVDAEGALLKPSEMFYKDALLLYRKTGRLVSLSANRPLRAMTFPEFLPDGRSILLDQAGGLRTEEVIRIVKVR
ncbi:hypothetical protein [Gemmatirosa kalamazoonensis]|nr:hypothetical protein [Gemmatirosa kalamazoonensis]